MSSTSSYYVGIQSSRTVDSGFPSHFYAGAHAKPQAASDPFEPYSLHRPKVPAALGLSPRQEQALQRQAPAGPPVYPRTIEHVIKRASPVPPREPSPELPPPVDVIQYVGPPRIVYPSA